MVSINDVLKASKGLPVDDIFAELWGRKLSGDYTIVTYTGTLPATLTGTKAGYLHRYKIYGNLEQTGTPTPSDPIYPSECGERTENLFDLSSAQEGHGIDASGNVVSQAGRITTTPIDVSDLSTVFITWVASSDSIRYIYATFSNGVLVERVANKYANTTIDVSSADQLYICLYSSTAISKSDFTSIMLNLGSTPLPYEPYGYKLPLTSAGQDVDIYLGESQTTRRIKKLVLTGEENTWVRNSSIGNGNAYNNTSIFANYKTRSGIGYCTHYPLATAASATIGVYFGAAVNIITALSEGIDTVDKWKTYLADQYAAGTPVTIWYILATEETGTLNEPLRKIGNYADTIDSTQTSAQIPTSAGSTTISWAGEGLAPSEVELTYERK